MLHGQFVPQAKEVGSQDRWQWLESGTLKHETESLIFNAHEQTIRTNVIKGKIDKSQEQTKFRMCGRADETINHIVRECPKHVHRESTKEGMIGLKGVFIGKFVERMESMLNQNGININQKWSLRMTHVKYLGILLYIKTIL